MLPRLGILPLHATSPDASPTNLQMLMRTLARQIMEKDILVGNLFEIECSIGKQVFPNLRSGPYLPGNTTLFAIAAS
jgi:hypothetical protein